MAGKIIRQHTVGGGRRVNFLNTLKIVTRGSNDPHRAIGIHNAQSVRHESCRGLPCCVKFFVAVTSCNWFSFAVMSHTT